MERSLVSNLLKCFIYTVKFSCILSQKSNEDKLNTNASNEKCCITTSIQNPLIERGNKCCVSLGCFSNQKGTFWEHLLQQPSCLSDIKPQFYLFSLTNQNQSSYVQFDYFSLDRIIDSGNIKIQNEDPLFIVVHGFNTKWPCDWMIAMKNYLLKLKNNVLLVNWTLGSNTLNYIKAAANTRIVGKALSNVIQSLVKHNYITLNLTTIIGFSLGAHLAGYAGSNLKSLNQIIGLDPAGPLFTNESIHARLDPSDASYVQVFHTNGKPLIDGGFGTMQELGHADFYANGGRDQPGCPKSIAVSADNTYLFNLMKFGKRISCSHSRCPWLFIDMLKQLMEPTTSCKFVLFSCLNDWDWINGDCFSRFKVACQLLDYNIDGIQIYKGKYFFTTFADNTVGSFCGRQFLLRIKANRTVKGSIKIAFYGRLKTILWSSFMQQADESLPYVKIFYMVVPWKVELRNIKAAEVFYSKYTTPINKNGATNFNILTFELLNTNGDRLVCCSTADVVDNIPKVIVLQTSC